jgi:hypothetical protein
MKLALYAAAHVASLYFDEPVHQGMVLEIRGELERG